MKNDLCKLVVGQQETIKNALKKIDANKKKFLLVTDEKGKLLGTLTDGDVRRALIAGADMDCVLESIYKKDSISLTENDHFADVSNIFRKEAIKFIPIVSVDGYLQNVITKDNYHAILLQSDNPDLTYDFTGIDDARVYFEVFHRPWGFYKTTVLNDLFQSKIMSISPEAALSFQYHHRREEHWTIVNGTGEIWLDRSRISVKGGDTFFIPKGCRHRLINQSKTTNLLVVEVQLGEYFGEDDIVRIEDQYGRSVDED